MKKYQLTLLIGTLLLAEAQECFADCYAPVRCSWNPEKSHNRGEVGPPLSGGRAYLWEFFFGMGWYPTEFYQNAFESSIKECSKQIPECAGDKCYVSKHMSSPQCASGPILAVPLTPVASDVCAIAQIDGNDQAAAICRQTCEQKHKKWTGTWDGRKNKDCVYYNPDGTSPNEAGSVCGCI
jgi:hypothetical protein